MRFGELLKKLRLERNIKQSELAAGLISRSSLSKIESGEHEPSFETGIKLITRLGVSLRDFERLYNANTSFSLLESYFENISETSANNYHISHLEKLKKSELSINASATIDNIYIIADNFTNFSQTDINTLRENILPIWQKFEKIETWQKIDLYTLNNILFFFPVDEAENITRHALNKIEKIYPELSDLKASFLNNLGLILLLKQQNEKAKTYFEKAIVQSRIVHRYDILITAKIRIGIAENDIQKIEQQINILNDLEDKNLLKQIRTEINTIKMYI